MRIIAALVVSLLPLTGFADERILSFHSEVSVMSDGMIEVTETIKVRAEGNRIKRGIYRDFPTGYEDRLGNEYKVVFTPLAVLRNEQPEAYHSQSIRRGVRTYFGSADRFIDHGVHTYTFRYRASRMLGFFDDHDELYWNVTGNDWAFPIDKASANILLTFRPTLVRHNRGCLHGAIWCAGQGLQPTHTFGRQCLFRDDSAAAAAARTDSRRGLAEGIHRRTDTSRIASAGCCKTTGTWPP